MCGRYTLKHVEALEDYIASLTGERPAGIKPRYNVSPAQTNPVVRRGAGAKPACVEMRWGLVPFWDKAEKPRFAPINARSEEMMAKPTFRQPVQQRRCAVPADGFYEWQRLDEKIRIPHHICLKEERPFCIAGLFEEATETRPETYCLLTTGPNKLMEAIHDRMPVILAGAALERWLTPGPISPEESLAICQPYPADRMTAWVVSTIVNNARNDVAECIAPVLSGGNDQSAGFELQSQ